MIDHFLNCDSSLNVACRISFGKPWDWEREVLKLTDGKGVDVTIDVAGGDGLNKSVAATKAAGVIAQVGFLTGQTSALNLTPLILPADNDPWDCCGSARVVRTDESFLAQAPDQAGH
ncbi:zinc-binding dehydrogenase [Caballeronia sp. GaOx3]|uniref:zinc-binding dehydrogenase n=1 Tax=Caballeronia sp. GaOx3 TaxID=2921740 RepID=UPI002028D865|nr:zinc-binding dehydrogenase [Caballeronia sp. GaOx3]